MSFKNAMVSVGKFVRTYGNPRRYKCLYLVHLNTSSKDCQFPYNLLIVYIEVDAQSMLQNLFVI